MNYQELCELADREIRLGRPDRALMSQALTEANGVTAHAHQIYWRLRATSIQQEARGRPGADELYARELKARLDAEEKRRNLRSNIVGWMWVFACVAGFIGAYIFFRAAKAAFYGHGRGFYVYAVSGVACILLAVIGYVVCKRDAGQDPFSD